MLVWAFQSLLVCTKVHNYLNTVASFLTFFNWNRSQNRPLIYTPVMVVVHPTSLTFGGIDVTQSLIAGNTYKLEPIFTPTYTTENGVTWSSSNTQVATVDENGLLSLLDNGQTTISITSTDNPDIGYSLVITVSGGSIPVNPGDGTGQNEAE